MGRVLLSMNLVPSDDPDLGIESLNGSIEPESTLYELRIEIIEVSLCSNSDSVWVEAKFGANSERTKEIQVKSSSNKSPIKVFKFGSKNGLVKEISANFPVDKAQVPDIFINIYHSSILRN